VVEEDSDGSGESLLSIQVVRKNKNLITTMRASVNDSHKLTQFQIDTGASCNILNHKDFVDLGKPNLDNNQTRLKQFNGFIIQAPGRCKLEVAGEKLYFLTHKKCMKSMFGPKQLKPSDSKKSLPNADAGRCA